MKHSLFLPESLKRLVNPLNNVCMGMNSHMGTGRRSAVSVGGKILPF